MKGHLNGIESRSADRHPIRRQYLFNKPFVFGAAVFITLQSVLFPSASAWSTPFPSLSNIFNKNEVTITSRREMLQLGLTVASILHSSPSLAAEENEGMMSTSAVAALLNAVPTFTIVDKKGVPFMVVGEDAKVTGYFFTEYGEAKRILNAAKTSADRAIAQAKKEGQSAEEVGTNPWTMARISTVPLDSAVTLATKSLSSFGGRNYFRLAPSEDDIKDALALTGQEDLAEGKVPLFYYADFTIDVDGEERSPLYFRKSELEEQFRKKYKSVAPSPVLVTELFAVLGEMVKPGGNDMDLQKLVFVAPSESERRRRDCKKAGGKEPPFFLGQRIIVL